MKYTNIQPPFTMDFPEMSKKELKDYFNWYLGQIPVRVAILSEAIQNTPSFETWHPDETPESLDVLGQWFAQHVKTRPHTEEEIEEIRSKLLFQVEIPEQELTNRTFSLAMDISMYFSKVFQKNYAHVRWRHVLGGKRNIDYGQPVLTGFSRLELNPRQLIRVQAYSLADRSADGTSLRNLYNIWASFAEKELKTQVTD